MINILTKYKINLTLNVLSPSEKYMQTPRKTRFKFAFTLSEILITLGIIGVVATLTLPITIKNYQNKQKTAVLKKTYSTLSQAIIMSQQEHGDSITWERFPYHKKGTLEWSNEYIFKYIKIITACEDGNSSLKCPTTARNIALPDGTLWGNPALHMAIFVLADDQNIYLFGGGNPDSQMRTYYIHVLVDTNGTKPPNKYGKDVFVFTLSLNKADPLGVLRGGSASRSVLLRQCKDTPESCAALLKFDNWEFRSDYPW